MTEGLEKPNTEETLAQVSNILNAINALTSTRPENDESYKFHSKKITYSLDAKRSTFFSDILIMMGKDNINIYNERHNDADYEDIALKKELTAYMMLMNFIERSKDLPEVIDHFFENSFVEDNYGEVRINTGQKLQLEADASMSNIGFDVTEVNIGEMQNLFLLIYGISSDRITVERACEMVPRLANNLNEKGNNKNNILRTLYYTFFKVFPAPNEDDASDSKNVYDMLIKAYKSFNILSLVIDNEALDPFNIEDFGQFITGLKDKKHKERISLVMEREIELTEKIIENNKFLEEYNGLRSLANELVDLVPKIEPVSKEVKEELDDELLLNLIILDVVNSRKIDTSQFDINILKSDPEVTERFNSIKEKDAGSNLFYGFEIEILEKFDKTSFESMKHSLIQKYEERKHSRQILTALMQLGIPIDQDALGEISMPKSRGYHAQLEAIRIFERLGVIPKGGLSIHINVSGFDNPQAEISELLTACIIMSATDLFGTISEADLDHEISIGFAECAQKGLIRDQQKEDSNIGVKGLPVMIKGERIEFRGIITGEASIDHLENGMNSFDLMLEGIRSKSKKWQKLKSKTMKSISRHAFSQTPNSLTEIFGKSWFEDIKNNLSRVVSLEEYMSGEENSFANIELNKQSTVLENYLNALSIFGEYLYNIESKGQEYLSNNEFKNKAIAAALSDASFIEFALQINNGQEPRNHVEILLFMKRYYYENDHYQFRGEQYQVKTWERMRGRVSQAVLKYPTFSAQIKKALAA